MISTMIAGYINASCYDSGARYRSIKYRTIVIDPPWRYSNHAHFSRIESSAKSHYSTMSIEELMNLDIKGISAWDSHLYLWTTNSFMKEAHILAEKWGFVVKTIITWNKMCNIPYRLINYNKKMKKQFGEFKPLPGLGYYFRNSTEHMLFCVRGKLKTNHGGTLTTSLFTIGKLAHSQKPECSYKLIENSSPEPRLEIFCRTPRNGWDCWGNEVKNDIYIGIKEAA